MGSALRSTGSTRKWRRIRAAILIRDGYVCNYCHRRADSVDHIKPRSNGGTDHPSNLVACCMACNLQRNEVRGNRYAQRATRPRGRGTRGALADQYPYGGEPRVF
jgi:5-methylcytosine-specific restriction endonuclease McrA